MQPELCGWLAGKGNTDRGAQYRSRAYWSALKRLGIRVSTNRTRSCLDGATTESFFATIMPETGTVSGPIV